MVVVTLPETLPVTECLELLEGLRETGMPIGGVVVNKVVGDDFTGEEREAIAPMIAEHSLFGATRFQGIGNMEASLAKLAREAAVPVWRLPELPIQGPGLIHGLSEAILTALGGAR
jgi:hypothetical protein